MKRIIIAAAALVCLIGPVSAQQKDKTPQQIEDDERDKEAIRIDKQYKATMQRMKDQGADKTVRDPWMNMREPDVAKTNTNTNTR